MKVQVETLSPIERKLSIEVEPAVVASELDRAYKALAKQVKVPGFRPGKAPRRILEQRFRRQIEDEVAERVIQRAWLEAVEQEKVPAVGSPSVIPGKLPHDGTAYTFEARVEVKPDVEAKDYEGLSLKKLDTEVKDSEVEERLEQLRQSRSTVEDVTDRDVAQKGDLAKVDYEATVDGEPFPGSNRKDATVSIEEGGVAEGNFPQLEGLKVGETREFDAEFPADFGLESVAGKTAHFKVTLNSLKVRKLPELDDALAKDTGLAETAEELRKKVREDLERARTSENEAAAREDLFKALIDKNPFQVPRSLVDRAIDMMLEGALRNMSSSGIDVRQLNLDFNSLRGELRPRAEQEVRGTLILEAIAKQEKIEATDADVDARIASMATEAGMDPEKLKSTVTPDQRESLTLRLREEKAIEFVKGRANYG
ncbi:MAG TPA: trigger factor [Myxococcaceae bacterium]|nr:trigger factor [Myxococcaceae bacterium]